MKAEITIRWTDNKYAIAWKTPAAAAPSFEYYVTIDEVLFAVRSLIELDRRAPGARKANAETNRPHATHALDRTGGPS